jgi:OOP family OmpA-OmpF porin
MLKKIIILSYILSGFLGAVEITDSEFPYIKPISVEIIDNSNDFKGDDDHDGVLDADDKCPNTKYGVKVDNLGCKLLKDDDHDGISNREDKCPKTKMGLNVDATGCAPDADKDGVEDIHDECPDTSKDFVVDDRGCPQTAVLKVNFEAGSYTITEDSLPKIEQFAEFLYDNPIYQAIIYGYTDNLDSDENNKKLSQKRADAVAQALIENGIKLTRLTAIGMGSKNPVADNSTPEGRAKNRRIEVELLK